MLFEIKAKEKNWGKNLVTETNENGIFIKYSVGKTKTIKLHSNINAEQ